MFSAVELLLKYGQESQAVLTILLSVFGVLPALLPAFINHRRKILFLVLLESLLLALISIALIPHNADRLAHYVLRGEKLSPNERLRAMLAADDAAHQQAALELYNEEYKADLEDEREGIKVTLAEQEAKRKAKRVADRVAKQAEAERKTAAHEIVGAWVVDTTSSIQKETIRFNDDNSCIAYFWDGSPAKGGRYYVQSPQVVLVRWDNQETIMFPSSLTGTSRFIQVTDHGNLYAYKEQS